MLQKCVIQKSMKTTRRAALLGALSSPMAALGLTKAPELKPEDKVDFGIPLQVDVMSDNCEHMEVIQVHACGKEEKLDLVQAVDVEKGEVLCFRNKLNPHYSPHQKPSKGDIFGHHRFQDRYVIDMELGPVVIKGDFRIRWRSGRAIS